MMQYLKGSDTLREMYPKVNENFENIDDQLKTHEQNFEDIDDRLNAHEQNFGNIEENIQQIETNLQDISDSFNAHKDEYAAYKNSNNLEIAKIKKEIADYKAAMALLNPNHEAKQAVEGYGIVNLPPNCANGQISVTAKGLTVTNLVQNGDFRNGTSGWSAGGSTLSADNGILRITATGTSGSPNVSRNLFTKRRGQKLYVRVKAKVTNSECQYIRLMVGLNSVYQYTPEANKEYLISGVLTMPIDDADIWYVVYHGYENAEVATGKVMEIREAMTVDLTAMFGAGNEPTKEECDKMFSCYIDGTKSTVCGFRIRSVSQDESQESAAYVLAKDAEGKIVELRSLPNNTKDEFNVVEGKHTNGVSDPVSVSGTMFASLDTTTYVNVDVVKTTAFSDAMAGTTSKDGMTRLYDKNGVELTEVAQTDIDNPASVGKYYWHTDKTLWLIVAKGAYADISAARTALGTMTLIYQLATPIEIPVQVSGTLVGYPSGTVYLEPFVPDAGVYTDKMEVLHKDLPIKSIEKISKVDYTTGLEYELDPTQAVISSDGLSFTHPALANGDIVFFIYEYSKESTIPEMTVEYYDSRFVVKDSVTGKFYHWNLVVANGQWDIQLTEV